MSINFPLILLCATVATGVIYGLDAWLWKTPRLNPNTAAKPPLVIEYARSFFPVLLIVLLLRSYLVQPFRVPSQSLEPTIRPGDFILVNQFDYGLRFPVWDKLFLHIGEPKVGDIVVFHWPVDPSIDFVKRVVGVPGDHISYINKIFYINGKQAKQTFENYTSDTNGGDTSWQVKKLTENLQGVTHEIYIRPDQPAQNFYNLMVPEGQYFMIGDNRDDSDDSRYWGFVSKQYLVGRGMLVWMNWNWEKGHYYPHIQWNRIGTKL